MDEDEAARRRRKRRAIVLGLFLLAALLVFLFSCDPRDRMTVDGNGEAELDGTAFTINGDTAEVMSPGVVRRIDLEITNPHGETMTVTDLGITVDIVAAPRADRLHPCSVDDFTVEQPEDGLRATVPAGTTVSFSSLGVAADGWPRVGMLDRPVNQDGCKDAVVTLAYSGSGALQG